MCPPSFYFATPLAFSAPTEGFLWDDFRKILRGGQKMAKVHSGEEILPKGSTPSVGCTKVTDRRQTDRRICNLKDVSNAQNDRLQSCNGLADYANLQSATSNRTAIWTSKVGQGDLVFDVRSGFANGSVRARLQVSVYNGYDLCYPGCPRIWLVHFDPCDPEK